MSETLVIREYVKASTKDVDSEEGFGYFVNEYYIPKGSFKKEVEVKSNDTLIRVRDNIFYEVKTMNGWFALNKLEFMGYIEQWKPLNVIFIKSLTKYVPMSNPICEKFLEMCIPLINEDKEEYVDDSEVEEQGISQEEIECYAKCLQDASKKLISICDCSFKK